MMRRKQSLVEHESKLSSAPMECCGQSHICGTKCVLFCNENLASGHRQIDLMASAQK
jgi:hypothetical protein